MKYQTYYAVILTCSGRILVNKVAQSKALALLSSADDFELMPITEAWHCADYRAVVIAPDKYTATALGALVRLAVQQQDTIGAIAEEVMTAILGLRVNRRDLFLI